jgi:multidrug efflux system membrane fusion protein
VPQAYAQAARPGTPTAISLEENPGKIYRGTLARTSSALDPSARTMLSEVEMDNPGAEVLPGAYVVVRLRVGLATHGLTIPANTLLFRSEGLRVAVVRDGRAELVPVTSGRDYGRSVEVVAGLQATDAVILDPADSLVSGAPVRVRPAEPPKPAATAPSR